MVFKLIRSKTHDLCLNWGFHLGESDGASDPGFDDTSWEMVHLPHSYNATDTFVPRRGYYRGPAWYRKYFSVPRRGRRIFLRVGAAWGKVQIWLNGQDLGTHLDGLAGFEVELTEQITSGENIVALRVDNTHDPAVLPGKPVPDYNIYGGICGEVWLAEKSRVHFPWRSTTITTPEISGDRAIVDITSRVSGTVTGGNARAIARIVDPMGDRVALTGEVQPGLSEVFSFHIEVPSPKLWSPETPSIYEMEMDLIVGGEKVDALSERFGIRQFEFDENLGFILNGERIHLRGVNRHQDFPGLGNALPRRLNRLDAGLISDMGGNFVRTSHYPQSPHFLDACDELGILVYEEITTWQFIGGEDFISSADSQMASMVRRDRNHPSVVLWGMMNEGRSRKMFERLKQTSLGHDPTRPTIYADNKLVDGVFQETIFVPHVLGVNYKLESIDAFHSAYPNIKILVSEHTNADNARRGETELERLQSERIARDLDIIEAMPYIAGSALWSMHDYGTDYEPVWPVQKSGILDIYRNPKEAYHMMRSRWSSSPSVHIASDWCHEHPPGDRVGVRVYSNCEEVELFLNGESLGKRSGESPMVFPVDFANGELRADGMNGGHVEVSMSRTSPGSATGIILSSPEEITADGRDAVILCARAVDENGNTAVSYDHPITFELSGPAELVGIGGSTEVDPVEGLANILVRSKTQRGEIVVMASGSGLNSASKVIRAH